MIKVKHPSKACNDAQEVAVQLLPEINRRQQELMFSHGNAAYIYHSNAMELEPNEEDYKEWLNGLDEKSKIYMSKLGYEKCKRVLSFTRYVNEKHDFGMDKFIENLMGAADFAGYMSLVNKN